MRLCKCLDSKSDTGLHICQDTVRFRNMSENLVSNMIRYMSGY